MFSKGIFLGEGDEGEEVGRGERCGIGHWKLVPAVDVWRCGWGINWVLMDGWRFFWYFC
jgi:hypothetical protein